MEYLYLIVLFHFDAMDEKDFKYIECLSISYPKLAWLYYFSKASKAYLIRDNITALINYEYVLNTFKETNNLERYLIAATNTAYLYNILGQYHLSYNITSEVIEYIFSEIDAKKRIQNLLVHYLFSNLMLERYDEIITFIEIVIFDYGCLNDLAASICVLAASKVGKLERIYKLMDLTFEDVNFDIIKRYVKIGDKRLLDNLVLYPYIKIIKDNAIF